MALSGESLIRINHYFVIARQIYQLLDKSSYTKRYTIQCTFYLGGDPKTADTSRNIGIRLL